MNKNKQNIQIGLGIPSIFMIFMILCLAIITTLAFTRSQQNLRIAQQERKYIQDYYQADALGEYLVDKIQEAKGTIYDKMKDSLIQEVLLNNSVQYVVNDQEVSLKLKINETQRLEIILRVQASGQLEIRTWELKSMQGV